MIGWRVGCGHGPADLLESVGWVHVYNTTTPTGIARATATAVLRGDQDHVADATSELERRRDTIMAALDGWPLVRPGRRLVAAGRRRSARHDSWAVEGALLERRDRGDPDDRLGRRHRRPSPPAGVQRRAGRAAEDDPRADGRDAARGLRQIAAQRGAMQRSADRCTIRRVAAHDRSHHAP